MTENDMTWRGTYIVLLIIFFLSPLSMAVSENNNGTPNITLEVTSDISSNVTSNITSVTYQIDVDNDYGFYRVIDRTTRKPVNYTNKTLNIYVGDTIIWMNDATPDEALTIISEQELWENRSAYLRWNYQKFSYIFNQSGIYTFYIREYKRLQHQTIIVKNRIDATSVPTMTVISTPTMTYIATSTINDTVPTPILDKKSEEGFKLFDFMIIIVVIIIILAISLYLKEKE